MKHFVTFIALLFPASIAFGQKTNPNYDAELATKLGAMSIE